MAPPVWWKVFGFEVAFDVDSVPGGGRKGAGSLVAAATSPRETTACVLDSVGADEELSDPSNRELRSPSTLASTTIDRRPRRRGELALVLVRQQSWFRS